MADAPFLYSSDPFEVEFHIEYKYDGRLNKSFVLTHHKFDNK